MSRISSRPWLKWIRQASLLGVALLLIPACHHNLRPEPGSAPTVAPDPPPGTTAIPPVTVSESAGVINVYFNKSVLTRYAKPGNRANQRIDLAQRLIHRLSRATQTIDFATYEINLPSIVQVLIDRAAAGVQVRVLADAKDADDPHYIERYETMRLHLERMVRGADGAVGTADDITVFSDSIILAVDDAAARTAAGLPAGAADLAQVTVQVGNDQVMGRRIADGELKAPGQYYSPDPQMHNKFAVVDGTWVFTGSWNFTVTGLYGSDADQASGNLNGNQQHVVELHSTDLAAIYKAEFDEMWGAAGQAPDPAASNFHGRKSDNTAHSVQVGGRTVEVFFSPGDDAVGRLRTLVANEAHEKAYFTIFAWSDQGLVDAMKVKWEGSAVDQQGTLTGFDVRGVFDGSFWNQWWSASIEMTGRTASRSSTNNPNVRWANPAPVFRDGETRKLHSKSMLIDAGTSSDPTVVVGSTNWSINGNDINDENLLIIHDAGIANQFLQEFWARYQAAGGQVP